MIASRPIFLILVVSLIAPAGAMGQTATNSNISTPTCATGDVKCITLNASLSSTIQACYKQADDARNAVNKAYGACKKVQAAMEAADPPQRPSGDNLLKWCSEQVTQCSFPIEDESGALSELEKLNYCQLTEKGPELLKTVQDQVKESQKAVDDDNKEVAKYEKELADQSKDEIDAEKRINDQVMDFNKQIQDIRSQTMNKIREATNSAVSDRSKLSQEIQKAEDDMRTLTTNKHDDLLKAYAAALRKVRASCMQAVKDQIRQTGAVVLSSTAEMAKCAATKNTWICQCARDQQSLDDAQAAKDGFESQLEALREQYIRDQEQVQFDQVNLKNLDSQTQQEITQLQTDATQQILQIKQQIQSTAQQLKLTQMNFTQQQKNTQGQLNVAKTNLTRDKKLLDTANQNLKTLQGHISTASSKADTNFEKTVQDIQDGLSQWSYFEQRNFKTSNYAKATNAQLCASDISNAKANAYAESIASPSTDASGDAGDSSSSSSDGRSAPATNANSGTGSASH